MVVDLRQPPTAQFPLDDFAPQAHRRRALLEPQHLPDLVTRATGAHVRQPVTTGLRVRIGQNLDRFRILEFTRQRCDATVHLGARAMRADLRVHGKREVEWRRALRQLNDITGRGEHEDLVLVQIELQEFEKLTGRLGIELKFEDLAKPRQLSIQIIRAA